MPTAAYARLGELRRRQGRIEEAVKLFEQAGSHPQALLGGAWIDLEQGNTTRALGRAPANELLVRIAARCAKPADAELPLAQLEKAAARRELPLLRAAVLSAKAVQADAAGADTHAAELMEDAAALYDNAGLVHEAATARRELRRRKHTAHAA